MKFVSQFYNSSIKTEFGIRDSEFGIKSLNSKIVRLKPNSSGASITASEMFQFYNSSIKTLGEKLQDFHPEAVSIL